MRRSPSQCPGTARSFGFGGPFPNVERPAQLALTVHHRVAAWPAGRVSRPQIAGQFLAQRTARLHEQRQIDRLVRHAHLRLVGELLHQPTRDLLRRPPQLELLPPRPLRSRAHDASFDGFGRRARRTAALSAGHARYRRRPPFVVTSREIVDGDRPSRRAIDRNDSPPARPREISSRSVNDNRNADRFRLRDRRATQHTDIAPHRAMSPPDLFTDQRDSATPAPTAPRFATSPTPTAVPRHTSRSIQLDRRCVIVTPTVESVTRLGVARGDSATLTVTGQRMSSTKSGYDEHVPTDGVVVNSVVVNSKTEIEVAVSVNLDAPTGERNLMVWTPGTAPGPLATGFGFCFGCLTVT